MLDESIDEFDRVLRRGGFVVIKEQRFGGTAAIVRESEALLEKAGYEKVLEKTSLLSCHSRLIKQ